MYHDFMKTIGAIQKAETLKQGVELHLYRFANISALLRILIRFKCHGQWSKTMSLAKIIHEDAQKKATFFCCEINIIRTRMSIIIPLPPDTTDFELSLEDANLPKIFKVA